MCLPYRRATKKSYDCSECGLLFNCNTYLQDHINSVHNNIKPHVCPEPGCQFRTAYRGHLTKHLKNHDGLKERFSCEWPECNFTTLYRISLQQHIRIHTDEKPFECQHSGCGLKFRTEGALKQHMECHSEYNNYICDCGLRYKTSQSLRKHKTRYCRYKLENVLNQSVVIPKVNINYNQEFNEYSESINQTTYYNEMNIPDHSYPEQIFWTSYECNQEFTMGSIPGNHVMLSNNLSNFREDTMNIFNICENGQESETLKTFIGENSGNSTLDKEPTICSEFGSLFNRNDQIKEHSYTNTNVKSYDCTKCGQKFKQKSHLEQHFNDLLNKFKPHVCPEPGCQFQTVDRSYLRNHLKIHYGPRTKFTCYWPGCNFVTFTNYSLESHIKTHSNVKSFECQHPGCGKKFLKRSYLNSHIECHSQFNNHVCDCGQRFKTRKLLLKHKRIYGHYDN